MNMCRAIVDEGTIVFDSLTSEGTTVPEIIQKDKVYGTMTPKNGKYFTVEVIDYEGKWITHPQIVKGVRLAWNMIEKIINIDCRIAGIGEYADFTVQFVGLKDDPTLTKNTLMYHYFPINDFNSGIRGKCVVNTDFTWTANGEGIPLNLYDPTHYPNPTTSEAISYDFDATYQHELCHGLGLPHSPNNGKKMSANYSIMAETIFEESDDETIQRLQAKYPKKIIQESLLRRWINYFKARKDRY